MGKLGENQRNNYYHVPVEKYDGILKHIKSATTDDVKQTIKDLRDRQINKYGSTRDMSLRHIGDVPADLYIAFDRKFPGFWNNKQNVREFFKIMEHLRIADKI